MIINLEEFLNDPVSWNTSFEHRLTLLTMDEQDKMIEECSRILSRLPANIKEYCLGLLPESALIRGLLI